jgi:dihydrofolate synthase / folylpolyglutamate synthase
MQYQEAIDYIYGFLAPTQRASVEPYLAEEGIARTRALLAHCGNPQRGLRCVIVAGTKGKGSTSVLLEAMLRHAGLRVGLWTSPHLSSYRERMQINRELISQAALIDGVVALQPLIESFDSARYGRPSVFEIGFVLALRWFRQQAVDLAVLEVGLGGRYDCANTCDAELTLISSISYDHMAILGHTLQEIAWNKAGIMRPHVPAVTVPQAAEAAAAIAAEAAAVAAPLWMAGPDAALAADGRRLTYPASPESVALAGDFQHENAALALTGGLLLREAGWPLSDAALIAGLRDAGWPARFELIAGPPRVLIDGAHNADSAAKLLAAIQHELPYRRLFLLLGTSRDKDIAGICAALVPAAERVVVTRSLHPRAAELALVADQVRAAGVVDVPVVEDIPAALDLVRSWADQPADLVVVTGSLFVAAAAREYFGLAVAD